MSKSVAVFFILFLFIFQTRGQIIFKGIVSDSENYMAMPEVNIYLKKASSGAITNADGRFLLHFRDKDINDTLVISYLGYFDYIIPIKSIDQEKDYDIKLKPDNSNEKVVSFNKIKPLQLIKDALSRLDNNIDPAINTFTSEMKETVKTSDYYIDYSDEITEVELPLVTEWDKANVKINKLKGKSRKTGFFDDAGSWTTVSELFNLRTNLQNILEQTWTSQTTNLINVNKSKAYEVILKYEEVVDGRKRLNQVIIYIDKKSYAILSLHAYKDRGYNSYDKELTIFSDKDSIIKYTPDFRSAILNYRQYRGKWILSNMKLQSNGRVLISKAETGAYIRSYNEYYTTILNISRPGRVSDEPGPPTESTDDPINTPNQDSITEQHWWALFTTIMQTEKEKEYMRGK